MGERRIVVGATGASGMPLLRRSLEVLRGMDDLETLLVMSDNAKLTLGLETDWALEELEGLADVVYRPDQLDAAPSSGTFETIGMLIVPCSMKTVAGINAGYSSDLLLRAADVTIKEHRPLVLAARESPMSPIHLRNLRDLSMIPGVWIVPPMLTFYHRPASIDDMVDHIVAKLLAPFGIDMPGYRRWE